jgi:soluble lytic murein transglycosylase-like protein
MNKWEFSWDRYAISHKLAYGLTQINPITARHFNVKWHKLDDPELAIKTGARVLSTYIRLCGTLRDGLMAYNAGPSVCKYADNILGR